MKIRRKPKITKYMIILGHDSTLDNEVADDMLDAESIYIYQAVRKVNKDVQILTELVYS